MGKILTQIIKKIILILFGLFAIFMMFGFVVGFENAFDLLKAMIKGFFQGLKI